MAENENKESTLNFDYLSEISILVFSPESQFIYFLELKWAIYGPTIISEIS